MQPCPHTPVPKVYNKVLPDAAHTLNSTNPNPRGRLRHRLTFSMVTQNEMTCLAEDRGLNAGVYCKTHASKPLKRSAFRRPDYAAYSTCTGGEMATNAMPKAPDVGHLANP